MKLSICKIVVLGVGLSIVALSCKNSTESGSTAVPVFSETPVNIAGPYNAANQTYGDIKFIAPVIQPFGYNLGDHLYPAIEYYTIPGAPVRAVTKGVVDTIITNSVIDGGDFQIRVISLPGSAYTVIYDHILNYKVQQKSLVYPGDTIGEAGYPTTTTRRTSLQVNYVDGTNTRAYCPLNFGDTSFVQQHRGLIAQYNALNFQPPYDSICISGPIIPQ